MSDWSQSHWVEAALTADEATADDLAERLRPFAEGESVAIEQLGDPHNLDPNALLPELHLKIYIAAELATAELRQQISAAVAPHPVTFTALAPTDWATAWKEHYHPLRIGQRFWIQPSWLAPDQATADDLIITLDPGMAFGTGQHPTTHMCLAALEELVRPGQRILDLGTGSGILAIGAALLGATAILAVDNDPLSVEATLANAALNGVAEAITVREGTLAAVPEQEWDIVVVNILATIIMPLLTEEALLDHARPGGYFIFSGIVHEQAAAFEATLTAVGGRIMHTHTLGDWVAYTVTHA